MAPGLRPRSRLVSPPHLNVYALLAVTGLSLVLLVRTSVVGAPVSRLNGLKVPHSSILNLNHPNRHPFQPSGRTMGGRWRARGKEFRDGADGETTGQLRETLFGLLGENTGIQRGQRLSDDEQDRLESVISRLQEMNPTENPNESPLLPGTWQLLCTFKPGVNVSFTDLNSWRKYLSGTGPSPIQSLVTGNTQQVNGVYQMLDLEGLQRFENIVKFSDGLFLNLTAGIVDKPDDSLIRFRFEEGNFLIRKNPITNEPLASEASVPYPVPFKLLSLLGDETIGSLKTLYLDDKLRISQGNKGSYFVFRRIEELPSSITPLVSSSPASEFREGFGQAEGGNKMPVVICPAQFGIPRDYEPIGKLLKQKGHVGVYPAPLSRFGWLRILPSTLTEDYWKGELKPGKALEFYYDAISKAYDECRRKHPGQKINFLGHSIGGWILRAWLKDRLSEEERQEAVASVTTLGTPHRPPPEDSIWKSLDQTRGLLTFVNNEVPGAFVEGAKYTCVVGNATRGDVTALLTSGVDSLENAVAYMSYLPLCGNGAVDGDGIVPLENGVIDESCEKIIIQGARHSGFLPTPGESIMAPEQWKWYGSEECLEQWEKAML